MYLDPIPTPVVTDIWNTLKHEARETCKNEPFLARMLQRVLLTPSTFGQTIVELLARPLADQDIEEKQLRSLFLNTIRGDGRFVDSTAQDLAAVFSKDPACKTHARAFLNYKGFQALQAHRFAHRWWHSGRHELAIWLSNRVSAVLGPDIHPAARIGSGVMLDHGSGIVFGETAVVEDNVTILQNVTLGGTGKVTGERHPKVRQGAMIGAGANIIGNIEIGAFSKVGAGSVVLKDVPPNCTMAGAPAQIVRIHSEFLLTGRAADI